MRLLLDTHVWLWSLKPTERLSRAVRRELAKSGNELYLSPVSIWEASHLARSGRLRLKEGISEWIEEGLRKTPLQEAPFNFAVAAAAARINLPQSDIGDVFLAATAYVQDLTLVTSDSQLLACSWLKTLAAD
jgi:PIN domain nuclease of toxin-antitoxin system